MATAKIDSIEDLDLDEQWGVVVGLTRKVIVTGLTGVTYATMYAALDAAGVPNHGANLDNGKGTSLQVVGRRVKMIDIDKAHVTVSYGMFNGQGQKLYADGIANRNVSGKMRMSVSQKDTNLYRPGGTGPKELILVSHTYPDDDPDYAGRTIVQSGTVNVNIPQSTFTIEGVKETLAPWQMARSLIGSINDRVWMGEGPGTWMCTGVEWEYRKAQNFFMRFEFQHDSDGWNPTAVFIDDRTDRPPVDVVDGVGVVTVSYFRPVDYVQELGFYNIGPAQA